MKYVITIETEEKNIENVIRNKFKFDFKIRVLEVKAENTTRTGQQNKSLHKFCTLQSDELQSKGIPMYTVLTFRPEAIWTMEAVKGVWKDIQFAEFQTRSTTKLKKVGQIETIHKVITNLIAESTKGHASTPPFPSNEHFREEYK